MSPSAEPVTPPQPSAQPLSQGLILLLAVACGVGVANVYFPQAVTPLLSQDFGVSDERAALVATTAQLGYAAGIFFLLPLGDRVSRRPLIASLFTAVAAAMVLAGTTSSLGLLYVFGAVAGIATVVPQVLIPMAADLVEPAQAGRVVGTLSGGLLGGVLLARAFGGLLGDWLGWQAPYLVASALALVLAVVLARAVPATRAAVQHRYPTLLATSLRLFAEQPGLRRSCLYQFALFGGFSAAWTCLALYVTGPDYGYSTGVVGVVALVGAASVVTAPFAGRMIDRRGPDRVSTLCFTGIVVSAVLLLSGLLGGLVGLICMTAAMLLLDVSVQSSQIANQARIFALVPSARSRLNSVYMTSVFLGGALGSLMGSRLYVALGWPAVCALLGAAGAVAMARHVVHLRAGARVTAS